jgi:hypothetical protein
MAKVFLSYRRTDTKAIARQLGEVLRQHQGWDAVFLDIDEIAPGQRFEVVISQRLRQADLVIALIGVRWLEPGASGAPRLWNPEDWVHRELEAAIELGVPVLPVLVGDAKLPEEGDLPTALKPIVTFNATRLDDGRNFQTDVAQLRSDIERLLGSHVDRQVPLTPYPVKPGPSAGAPGAPPSGVLLDRQHAYALTSYCADPAENSPGSVETKYGALFDVLGRAVLLFDRIYLEQHYVSSIAWTLKAREVTAFNRTFVGFSFDDLPFSPQDRFLLRETIETDLKDPAYRREIDLYYEARPLKASNYREIVTYVNNAIFASCSQGWSILPSKARSRLFSFKLSRRDSPWNATLPLEVTRHALDLVIPEISVRSLHELDVIREHPQIRNFREKVWELSRRAAAEGTRTPEAMVLAEFRDASRKLADTLRTVGILQTERAPISVPLSSNASLEVGYGPPDHPSSWLLFLHGLDHGR